MNMQRAKETRKESRAENRREAGEHREHPMLRGMLLPLLFLYVGMAVGEMNKVTTQLN
jgi:hypothetical protein